MKDIKEKEEIVTQLISDRELVVVKCLMCFKKTLLCKSSKISHKCEYCLSPLASNSGGLLKYKKEAPVFL